MGTSLHMALRFGILYHGVLLPWIEATRRLRQECPLSPCLFPIVLEYLSSLIHHHMELSLPIGFRISPSASLITRLLLRIMKCSTPLTQMQRLKSYEILSSFYGKHSGKTLNLSKSSAFLSHCKDRKHNKMLVGKQVPT
ncbi:hypothetical protein HPP92_026233 [Vanilla planifolia]|uniref:Uncharacterized protein n=1 Tax=Vanilla planifolia TaxID=51239 RepID=A0A835PHB4_VANPL|nr:hypothetical protein HPP92_026233 [Vanilla planifolia]